MTKKVAQIDGTNWGKTSKVCAIVKKRERKLKEAAKVFHQKCKDLEKIEKT